MNQMSYWQQTAEDCNWEMTSTYEARRTPSRAAKMRVALYPFRLAASSPVGAEPRQFMVASNSCRGACYCNNSDVCLAPSGLVRLEEYFWHLCVGVHSTAFVPNVINAEFVLGDDWSKAGPSLLDRARNATMRML